MFERRNITKRETEVVRLVAEGFRNKEVAQKLKISVKTVETHRANIMNKLGLQNVAQLIHYAVRKGIIHISQEAFEEARR
ncbi:MAG TPA: response regulator transcription factor [Candidatus Manganitrophaceae bacterium]